MKSTISDFVHDALRLGVPRESIIRALEKGGWSSKEIQAALDEFVDGELPIPVPRKRASTSPREAFFFLMLFSSLYAAAFAVGSLIFDLINVMLPLPGETHPVSSIRYAIASAVVAFPVFLFMCRIIAREAQRNPGQRISPVRRWLTYLTLFVASISIISDLIALMVRFLEGDITTRFLLKVLAVGILAGSAFIYYLRDLRRDEVAPSTEYRLSRAARVGFATMTLGVLVVLGFGLWHAGSPIKARLIEHDEQRVRDLIQISNKVQLYYRNYGVLPASLDACDGNPETFIDQKRDRITGQPYIYMVMDATRFRVGATFDMPSKAGSRKRTAPYARPGEDQGFWEHGAGLTMFTIDASRKDR